MLAVYDCLQQLLPVNKNSSGKHVHINHNKYLLTMNLHVNTINDKVKRWSCIHCCKKKETAQKRTTLTHMTTHICTHTHAHTHHTYTHTHTHTHTHINTYAHTFTHMYTHTHPIHTRTALPVLEDSGSMCL